MEGFVIRVAAYHGDPQKVGNVYTRSGISNETPLDNNLIVNELDKQVIIDLSNPGQSSDYTLDALIEDFQDEYGCKVSYAAEDTDDPSINTIKFDIFEPSWPEKEEAEDVVSDFTRRLVDWVHGYPSGR